MAAAEAVAVAAAEAEETDEILSFYTNYKPHLFFISIFVFCLLESTILFQPR